MTAYSVELTLRAAISEDKSCVFPPSTTLSSSASAWAPSLEYFLLSFFFVYGGFRMLMVLAVFLSLLITTFIFFPGIVYWRPSEIST